MNSVVTMPFPEYTYDLLETSVLDVSSLPLERARSRPGRNALGRERGTKELWGSYMLSIITSRAKRIGAEPCKHDEIRLWEYAHNLMDEREEESFSEEIRNCTYCLIRLLNIQEAVNLPQQEEDYSSEEIVSLFERSSNRLLISVILGISLNLLAVSGVEKGVFKRRDEQETTDVITVRKTFPECTIRAELRKTRGFSCQLDVEVSGTEAGKPLERLRLDLLYADHKMHKSRAARDGKVTFRNIGFGNHRVQILQDENLIGEIDLSIREEQS